MQLKVNEPQRLSLYKLTASLIRAYADIASEMEEAGYSMAESAAIRKDVAFYENLRNEVKIHSGDAIDLKRYEPAMRHLIDSYIRAEESEKVSTFDDMSLVQLIVERGADALNDLPEGIRKNQKAVAETIENNVRRLIIDETPINPKYYERMSELLDALVKQRKSEALEYAKYLEKIVELTKQAKNGPATEAYPKSLNSKAKRALYDNLGKNEKLALMVDDAVKARRQDGWRGNATKIKRVRFAILEALEAAADWVHEPGADGAELLTDRILELVKQHETEY